MRKYNLEEIFKIINAIEMDYPVADWIINGIQIWPLLRFKIFIKLYIRKNTFNKRKTFVNKLSYIINRIRLLLLYFKDISHNWKLGKANVIFLTNYLIRVELMGSYYNKLIDPILERLSATNISFGVLERNSEHNNRIPRYSQSKYIDLAHLFISLKKKYYVIFKRQKYRAYLIKNLKGLNYSLKQKYNILLLDIVQEIIYLDMLSCYYKKILLKSKPVATVVICYYNIYGLAFIKACKDLKIKTFDLQHGNQGEYHFAYGKWRNVPRTGYQLLPDYFLVWGDEESENIDKIYNQTENKHKSLIIGNLWLNKWLYYEDRITNYYFKKVEKLKINVIGRRKHILYIVSDKIPPDMVFQIMKEEESNLWWWIRVHPGRLYLQKQIKVILNEMNLNNYYLYEANELPLYALLKHVDLHITRYSTTVKEARVFEVPSIILDSDIGSKLYSKEIDEGSAFLADNYNELKKRVLKNNVLYNGMNKYNKKTNDKLDNFINEIGFLN